MESQRNVIETLPKEILADLIISFAQELIVRGVRAKVVVTDAHGSVKTIWLKDIEN